MRILFKKLRQGRDLLAYLPGSRFIVTEIFRYRTAGSPVSNCFDKTGSKKKWYAPKLRMQHFAKLCNIYIVNCWLPSFAEVTRPFQLVHEKESRNRTS